MMVSVGFVEWPMSTPFTDLQWIFVPMGSEEDCCNSCLDSSSLCVAAVTTREDSATLRLSTYWLKREPLPSPDQVKDYTTIRQGFIQIAGNSTGSSQSSTESTF